MAEQVTDRQDMYCLTAAQTDDALAQLAEMTRQLAQLEQQFNAHEDNSIAGGSFGK